MTTSIIVGGSGAPGRVLAQRFADRGDTVVTTSRTRERADAAAAEIADTVRGSALGLSRPETIVEALVDVVRRYVSPAAGTCSSQARWRVRGTGPTIVGSRSGRSVVRP
ncbi:hypothetical protein [Kitasatospora sp. NPDC087314]|uniref:hypothetical protein n=1 Tax=Kitasatospora sp. NPDC087314 TaxID=3364068 RepID=UPI0038250E2D